IAKDLIGQGKFINQKVNFYYSHQKEKPIQIQKIFSNPDLVATGNLHKSFLMVLWNFVKKVFFVFMLLFLLYYLIFNVMTKIRTAKHIPVRPIPNKKQIFRELFVGIT